MTTDLSNQHKAGDSYARLLTIPAEFANGYFVGWTPKSVNRILTITDAGARSGIHSLT